MPKSPTTHSEHDVRTRAYLMWEADGRPFGRDEHYWGLALAELSAPAPKARRMAKAASAVAEKKAKPAAKAGKPAKAEKAAKPAKGKAPVARSARKK